MKKIALLLLLTTLFVACKDGAGRKGKISESDSLRMELNNKDALLNNVFSALDEITTNLDRIKEREGIITSAVESAEVKKEPTLRIGDDINAIDKLLESNREEIKRLQYSAAQLKKANIKVASLEALIVKMTAQVESKSDEIARMKRDLDGMQFEVETLTVNVADLTTQVGDLIQDKTQLEEEVTTHKEVINTAYYIVGSSKELVDKGIAYKSGFIGRTLKVNENSALDKFTQVDTRRLDRVLVGYKNIEIVTSHPEGSYTLVQDDKGIYTSITITDKAKFWEYSKVLIVSHK